jgi:subtilase family serine protease
MIKRVIFGITLLVGVATLVATPAFARAPRVVDDNDRVVLRGNVHPLARPEFDEGLTDFSLPMEHMVLTVRLSPDKQAELDRLLAEQQDSASVNFHRWLTPEEFGERFGPGTADIDAITGWLTTRGFTVDEVAKGRTWINFSGKVADVERAFHTRIHDYFVNGHHRHANAGDPAIPRGLADLVAGIVSLHNFPRKMMNSGIRPLTPEDSQPDYTSGSSHYLAPGDFAIIYNVNPLYTAGIDGTGQSIAIVGRTHPSSTNWTTFRSSMGLPANPPQVIVNGADPGDLGADEDGEADLDVEWSGAVAKNATIKFVVSKSTNTTDGVDLSAQYIINNNLAPVMSTSFGQCESQMGSAENSFYNNLWLQAASEGITSFVSSGDSGTADCSSSSAASGSGPGVNGLASTPYNVAVGGTRFNDGAGGYWNSTNGTADTSAIGYIPETAWNESGNVSGGSGLWATGGGVSSIYGKPLWQVAPGVPADGKRDVPDVSLSAAGHDGYLVRTQGALAAIGGTSASSPSFAGLMALIVQKTGQRQGNANIRFYQLGNAQYGSGGAVGFHDITSGNNSVPGVVGYSCTTGYDLATGLGSVDANMLVNNWAVAGPATGVNITSVAPASSSAAGTGVTFNVVATGGSGTYQYRLWALNPVTGVWTGSAYGTSPLIWNTTGLPAGTYNIQVWARNVGSTAPYEAYTTTTYTLTTAGVTPVASVSLTSVIPASPSTTGTGVTFNAVTAGGSGFPQYQLWEYNPATASWTGSTYGTSPLTWNTAGLPAGTYIIQVWARNVGSTSPYEAFTTTTYTLTAAGVTPVASVSLTSVTPASPQLSGTAITFTASAAGGSGTPEYQLWVRNPTTGIWTGSAYGTRLLTWATTGLPVGTYNLQVWSRNVGSAAAYEAYATTTYILQ